MLKTTELFAGLIAVLGLVLVAEPALAKKARLYRAPPPTGGWYRLSGNVEVLCVERSFSVSVGNPAYPNRAAYWPAPCRP
ncbi:MAG TPA: hypothetical protein VKD68_05205 [Methyloceanibacter sp.]|jgi:hypothetical protein|nr:hypothetical protein [Methyloceanibacter sp.]